MKFTIPGSLPTMNEIVKKSKAHYMAYSNMKKDYTALVAISAGNLPNIKRADFEVTWYCKDKRKDKDNIIAGQKFIFDGLIKAGKMKNDGWDEVGDIAHRFAVDKKFPRVEVKINEI